MAQAMQHFRLMMDSVDIISKTVYCKTLFYRYGFAVENAQIVPRNPPPGKAKIGHIGAMVAVIRLKLRKNIVRNQIK